MIARPPRDQAHQLRVEYADAEARRIAKGIPLLQSMGLVGTGFLLALTAGALMMWILAG